MTAFAGVPCKLCRHTPEWHAKRVAPPDTILHTYAPDSSSLEAVAVELTAALDGLLSHWSLGGKGSRIKDRLAVATAALAAARAIGIKPPTDEAGDG